MPLLSILVPLYNEEEFIVPLLERVLAAPLPEGMAREILVVDDGSTDGSAEIVGALICVSLPNARSCSWITLPLNDTRLPRRENTTSKVCSSG